MIDCKTCGHTKEDHKGVAMICMKRIGENPDDLCDCNWFDDGTTHILPMRQNVFTLKEEGHAEQETNDMK